MKSNGIKHIHTPYQPSTNGLAKRFVQTFKRALKTNEGNGRPVHHRLASFLFSYRNTTHTTTTGRELLLMLTLHTQIAESCTLGNIIVELTILLAPTKSANSESI